MNLEIKKTSDYVLLKPASQNIDVTVSTEFKSRVADLINRGHLFFLLDLSQVDFIDSSGLGAMISILKTLRLHNGDLVLCDLKPTVLNLLQLTRMHNVFIIRATEKEGIESLAAIKK